MTLHGIIEQGKKSLFHKDWCFTYADNESCSCGALYALSSFALKIAEATRDAMAVKEKSRPFYGEGVVPSEEQDMADTFYTEGYNVARSDSLKRYEEFMKKR